MSVICTVTSTRFHPGTGALLNSLAQTGYRGSIILGCLDGEPVWFNAARSSFKDLGIHLVSHKLDNFVLPHYQKVDLIAFSLAEASGQNIFYIDSDIIVKKPWDFFENWVEQGIALCSDVNFLGMSQYHPMRAYWACMLTHSSFNVYPRVGYANSGFIGLMPKHAEVIRIWKELISIKSRERQEMHGDVRKKEHGFITYDQDLLNAALMAVDFTVSLVGPEGMSFAGSAGYMVHPIGPRKPWNRGYLLSLLLNGIRLPLAAREYWKYVRYPIKIASNLEQFSARVEMDLTSALSRIMSR